MNWKKFLKPTIREIIVFAVIILVFGVPATSHSCQTYVTTPTPPPCIEKFTFANIIVDALGLTRYPYMLDASVRFSYDPSLVGGYIVVLYLALSLIFYFYHQRKKAR